MEHSPGLVRKGRRAMHCSTSATAAALASSMGYPCLSTIAPQSARSCFMPTNVSVTARCEANVRHSTRRDAKKFSTSAQLVEPFVRVTKPLAVGPPQPQAPSPHSLTSYGTTPVPVASNLPRRGGRVSLGRNFSPRRGTVLVEWPSPLQSGLP